MKKQDMTRKGFIDSYRREHRWVMPFMMLGSALIAAMPLLVDTTALGYLGTAILAPTMAYGAMKSFQIARASDAYVLRAASERHLGLFALIGVGGLFFYSGVGGNILIWAAIMLCIVPQEMTRVAQARNFALDSA